MKADPVVIVSAARTPMGAFQGELRSFAAPELGAAAIRAAVERAKLKPEDVQEVLMGCVLPAGQGQAPARQAALGAGLALSTGCTTVNKMCGSGMKAAMFAHDSLLSHSYEIVVAGGMAPERPVEATAKRGLDLAVQGPGDLEAIVRAVGLVADQAGQPGAERAPAGEARVGRIAEREVEAHEGGSGLAHEQAEDEGFRFGPGAEILRLLAPLIGTAPRDPAAVPRGPDRAPRRGRRPVRDDDQPEAQGSWKASAFKRRRVRPSARSPAPPYCRTGACCRA